MSEIPDMPGRPADVPWHTEAKCLVYSSFEINGIQINLTLREGATGEMGEAVVLAYLDTLTRLYKNPRIKTMAAMVDYGRTNKHSLKPQTGHNPEHGEQPEGNVATPPVPTPPITERPPEVLEPLGSPLDGGGGQETFHALCRVARPDNTLSFSCKFRLRDGREAIHPVTLAGSSAMNLGIALGRAGMDPNGWEVGKIYDLKFTGYYKHGKQVPGSNNRYKDWYRFDIA